jgi:hypothetical protein
MMLRFVTKALQDTPSCSSPVGASLPPHQLFLLKCLAIAVHWNMMLRFVTYALQDTPLCSSTVKAPLSISQLFNNDLHFGFLPFNFHSPLEGCATPKDTIHCRVYTKLCIVFKQIPVSHARSNAFIPYCIYDADYIRRYPCFLPSS